ncbi:hypothetical protein Avi_7058 (plasmid) [Allorhizobium ampelinum S4]|uniref:Uncharacterized protein n=2 Tax=Rhizobium/Agrobacterium group TaxID=227290 RepID=B9K4J3_ALLAM|nr:hypothetical protein Avi_7058 [Allorhizobium ampelinum S4]
MSAVFMMASDQCSLYVLIIDRERQASTRHIEDPHCMFDVHLIKRFQDTARLVPSSTDDLTTAKEHIGRHCEFARGIALQPEWDNTTSPISVLSNSGGSSRL